MPGNRTSSDLLKSFHSPRSLSLGERSLTGIWIWIVFHFYPNFYFLLRKNVVCLLLALCNVIEKELTVFLIKAPCLFNYTYFLTTLSAAIVNEIFFLFLFLNVYCWGIGKALFWGLSGPQAVCFLQLVYLGFCRDKCYRKNVASWDVLQLLKTMKGNYQLTLGHFHKVVWREEKDAGMCNGIPSQKHNEERVR